MSVEIEKPDLKRSVTAGDIPPGSNGVYALNFLPSGSFGFGPGWMGVGSNGGQLPDLPSSPGGFYWTPGLDAALARTTEIPSYWASAVSIAISQTGSKAWEITGGGPTQRARAQDILHGANADEGYHHFIAQILMDYFTTNNGLFFEIVRASDSPSARITGIFHLDSLRCRRTGIPETPVIYFNQWTNEWHYLKWYQVRSIAHDPTSRSNYFGIGRCAAHYAYDRIRTQNAFERFTYEKATGGQPHELTFINLHEDQLAKIFQLDSEQRISSKMFVYRGSTVVPAIVAPGGKIETTTVKLASLPDNYDPDKELARSMLSYANALGLDPQDLQPLASSNLGTSTQSLVLHQKAKGRGAAWFLDQWASIINKWVLPDLLTLHYIERDLDDELKKAQVEGQQIGNVMQAMGAQAGPIITAQQGLNKLVDENVFPPEFLPEDVTPDNTLEDDEKPEQVADAITTEQIVQQAGQVGQQLVAPPQQQPGAPANA